jgi:FeS assembly SUF system protein
MSEEQTPTTEEKHSSLKDEVISVLRTVFDPEIPVNIYDLGLIYEVNTDENNEVDIVMTFTSPACPTAGTILNEINYRVSAIKGVKDVRIKVTWDPPWDKAMASERAKIELSQIFGDF